MPTQKITDRAVAATVLADGACDLLVWDTDLTGFALRVRPKGKSWIVAYRPKGAGRSANMKRLKLGSVQVIPRAADARQMARMVLGKVANGVDPLAERQAARTKEKSVLADLLDRYEEDLIRRRYVKHRDVMSGLRSKLSAFLKRDIRTLASSDYAGIVEALEKAGKPGAAADFRTHCRAFLTWCVSKAMALETNPLTGHRKERATRADKVDEAEVGRALPDDELLKIWDAASEPRAFHRMIRFFVLGGCRRGEGGGLTRAMVDGANKRINLPAIVVKQGREHVVYISPLLDEVLQQSEVDAASSFVFPSPRTGGKMAGWSKLVPAFKERAGVDFDLHDLRRTFRTGLSRLGVELNIAELAIGHARPELERIYNRDEQETALRDAFARWDAHVQKLIGRPQIDVFA